VSTNKGRIPHGESVADKGLPWPFVLASLMLVSLLVTRGRVWAAPGQDPQRQTVPTPTEVPKTETEAPPRSEPTLPALPTSTSTPSPLPTATSVLTIPVPAASPSAQLTLLPAPARERPTVAQMCQPLEKMASPLRGGELDLLVPCRMLVKIPAEAVIEDTLLRLAPRLLTDAPPSDAWLQMRSVAFTLDALSVGGRPLPGFIFARPCTVTIRYNQTDVEIGGGRADDLTIAHYDAAAHQWTPLDSQVDPKEKLVSAKFDQPGGLALMLVLSKVEGMNMSEHSPMQQVVSTLTPPSSGTGNTMVVETSVPLPSSQPEEASSPTCFLGIAGAPFLLALAAGLYVARRRQREG